MELLEYIKSNNGFLEVKVITRSSENKIFFDNNIWKIKVNEVPENGKANKVIVELIHKELNVPKGSIKIIKGSATSHKILKIDL